MSAPDPFVPADVDLRGFAFMPLDTLRLLDSDLFALSTGDEFKAAVAIWCKAWQQVPAASLPDDERILAHLSGTGPRWKKLRKMAMRGFVQCSDGRWYHPVIAQKALEAWQRREEWQEAQGNRATRQQRWRQRLKEVSARLRELGVTVPAGASLEVMERLLVDVQPSTPASTEASTKPSTQPSTAPSTVDASETGKTGTGTGTGTENLKAALHAASREAPTRKGAVAAMLRALGVDVTPADPNLVAWVEAQATDEQLGEAVERARLRKPAPARIPSAYLNPIVADVLNPPAQATPKAREPEWWASEHATIAKGREFGLNPRPGEEMAQFRGRIRDAMAKSGGKAA